MHLGVSGAASRAKQKLGSGISIEEMRRRLEKPKRPAVVR
jgi:hypothetical protein